MSAYISLAKALACILLRGQGITTLSQAWQEKRTGNIGDLSPAIVYYIHYLCYLLDVIAPSLIS